MKVRTGLLLVVAVGLAAIPACQWMLRSALFFPTHNTGDSGLARWTNGDELIGWSRPVPDPDNVWLMLHGNAGQAADRAYALGAFSDRDSVFILEYPGYGARSGTPSRSTFDAAALEGYELLRQTFPGKPICVAAESIGSGPASTLASAPMPPDKFVFITPFDDLKTVAAEHVRFLPVGLILSGSWNNVESLASYRGPIEVFGASDDQVINVEHARKLAASRPQAVFHLIAGGHNEWSTRGEVRVHNP